MRSEKSARFLHRQCLVLGLGVIIALSANHLGRVNCELADNDIWSKYRPVAMDESWTMVTNKPNYVNGIETLPKDVTITSKPIMVLDRLGENRADTNGLSFESGLDGLPRTTGSDQLIDIEQWRGQDVKDTLFRMPSSQTTGLTRLITSGQSATFMDEEVKMPVAMSSNSVGGEKILARYKIIVPIYVPALKAKRRTTAKPAPIRYVTEKITEMVQRKVMVPHYNEVIKAERVPQQLIVDYVRAKDGKSVPGYVDDKVRPGETLVKSEVKNFD